MKKSLLLLILGLTSCVIGEPLSYECVLIDHTELVKYGVNNGDYLCFSKAVVDKAHLMNYSRDDFIKFANYVVTNHKLYHKQNQDGVFGDYYADEQGNKIPGDRTIHTFGTKQFDEYTQYKNLQEVNKLEKDNIEKAKKLENKYKLKFCSSNNETNCLIQIPYGRYSFLQHINQGTLITTSKYALNGCFVGPNLIGADVYLIVGGTDTHLTENSFVDAGEFKVLGTYNYKSIRGVEKRAMKIQRLR